MKQEVVARAIWQAKLILRKPRSPLSERLAKAVIARWEQPAPHTTYRCRR